MNVRFEYFAVWSWKPTSGYRMINKVASSFQVGRRVQCLANCTVSPICDSYNYRASDKTCQLNTHDTPLIANSADIVADSDWSWWKPTFADVVWTFNERRSSILSHVWFARQRGTFFSLMQQMTRLFLFCSFSIEVDWNRFCFSFGRNRKCLYITAPKTKL